MTQSVSSNRSWLAQFGLVMVVVMMSIALGVAGHVNRRDASRPNTFLNKSNLVENVATPMSYYAIMAVGVTIVIISGGIDISVGSIMGLSAILTAWTFQSLGKDSSALVALPVGIGLPILIGGACGLANGLLIVLLRLHPFIVTLSTMSIFRGLVNVLPPEKTMPIARFSSPDAFTSGFIQLKWFGVEVVPLLIILLVTAMGAVYLKYFVWGRQTYAVGGNEEAARLCGVNVGAVKIRSYVLSGVCAGIAGMILLGRWGRISATTGESYELMVIAAAVVGGASLAGGRGTALGAMLGALVIGLIENGIFILNWDQEQRKIIIGTAILVAASLDLITGSLGTRSRRASA